MRHSPHLHIAYKILGGIIIIIGLFPSYLHYMFLRFFLMSITKRMIHLGGRVNIHKL